MIDKETYKRELVRMWDAHRDEGRRGYERCHGVKCEECPLYSLHTAFCENSVNAFEIIEEVEKWAKENPPKKYKVSRMEYDILQEVYSIHGNFRMYQNEIINNLREKGYFKDSYEDTEIEDYLNDCEVEDNDDN